MKYTSKSLDSALKLLLPNIRKAMKEGVNFSYPDLLRMVAEDNFTNTFDTNYNPSYDERLAIYICQEAMIDLKQKGKFKFGNKEFIVEDIDFIEEE